jgi:hypothetical protein
MNKTSIFQIIMTGLDRDGNWVHEPISDNTYLLIEDAKRILRIAAVESIGDKNKKDLEFIEKINTYIDDDEEVFSRYSLIISYPINLDKWGQTRHKTNRYYIKELHIVKKIQL